METDRPGRVVVAAFRKSSVGRVNRIAEFVCPRGVELTVLVADGQGWRRARKVDPRAEVYSLGRAENAGAFVRTYALLVERAPRGVLRRLESRLPGRAGRAAGRLRRTHHRVASRLRGRLFWRVYPALRPQLLRRLARRRLEPLRLETADLVVVADDAAVPFGWMLTKRFPDLRVSRVLDKRSYEQFPLTEAEWPNEARVRSYIYL